jgi:hypothetical protein
MLRFKQFILEYLTPEEKKQVSTWDKRTPEATKATDHFFGVGNEDHYEPLVNTGDKSEVHRAIERHTGRTISQEDYNKGLIRDENGKQKRIGEIISDPGLKTQFKTDNTRKNVKANNLSVRTTRSAEGVAGQTSHGQGWKEKSCKNFNTGINRHYLPKEVMHGTVVSYLHDHKGKEIARATFHPHINAEGNVVYRRDSYYGLKHPEFENHNREMEFRLSHPHVGSEDYIKHPEVYNDNGVRVAIHPEKAKKLGYEFSNKIRSGTHTHDDIDNARDHGYFNDEHRHLLGQHLTKKIKDGTHNPDDMYDAREYGYLNDEHKKLLPDALTKKIQAGTHTKDDLYDANDYGYFNNEHRKLLSDALTKKLKDGTHTVDDITHARYHEYLNDEHKKLLPEALTKKIQAGTHNWGNIYDANDYGYLNDEHRKLLSDVLKKKLKDGTHTVDDINNAREYGYLNDEHRKLLPDALTKKIQAGTYTTRDIDHAKFKGYLNDDHRKLIPDALTKKIQAGTHTTSDINHANRYGYLNDNHKNLLDYDLKKKIQAGTHTDGDIMFAKDYGYFGTKSKVALINHPDTNSDELTDMGIKSNDPEVHKAIANNKNANDVILYHITKKSNDPEVHKAIANNKNTEQFVKSIIYDKYNKGYVSPEEIDSKLNSYLDDAIEKKNRWNKQKEIENQQYKNRMQKVSSSPMDRLKNIQQDEPEISVPISARDKRFGVTESNQKINKENTMSEQELEEHIFNYVNKRSLDGLSLEESLLELYNIIMFEDLEEDIYSAAKRAGVKKSLGMAAKTAGKYLMKAPKGIWNAATKTPSFRNADDFINYWGGKIKNIPSAIKQDRETDLLGRQDKILANKQKDIRVAGRQEKNRQLRRELDLDLTSDQIKRSNTKIYKKAEPVVVKPISVDKTPDVSSSQVDPSIDLRLRAKDIARANKGLKTTGVTPKQNLMSKIEKGPTKTSLGLTKKQIASSNKALSGLVKKPSVPKSPKVMAEPKVVSEPKAIKPRIKIKSSDVPTRDVPQKVIKPRIKLKTNI